MRRLFPFSVAALLLAAGCGGSSPSPTPTAPAPIPAAQACDALGGLGATLGNSLAIYSGTECSHEVGPVVKLNLRLFGTSAGPCSGTGIGPRAVLAAAHCLDGDVDEVLVWFGTGPQYPAASFVYYPGFAFNQSGF